ncbi:MAG: hypothetical protein R2854_29345 [Caldilineaceae bacterium]
MREPVAAIERLVAGDSLAGDDATPWLSPVLRRFLYQRETPERRRVRHHRIGAYYRAEATRCAQYTICNRPDDSAAAALLLADAWGSPLRGRRRRTGRHLCPFRSFAITLPAAVVSLAGPAGRRLPHPSVGLMRCGGR